MESDIIISMNELRNNRKIRDAEKACQHYIQYLENKIAKKRFRPYTLRIFQQFIDWIKQEYNTPQKWQENDAIYNEWHQRVEERMNQDILRSELKLLHVRFKILKGRRFLLKTNIRASKMFPSKQKAFSPLSDQFIQSMQDVNNSLVRIEPRINNTTKRIFSDFALWLTDDVKKPFLEQAGNRKYTAWQKKTLLRYQQRPSY